MHLIIWHFFLQIFELFTGELVTWVVWGKLALYLYKCCKGKCKIKKKICSSKSFVHTIYVNPRRKVNENLTGDTVPYTLTMFSVSSARKWKNSVLESYFGAPCKILKLSSAFWFITSEQIDQIEKHHHSE